MKKFIFKLPDKIKKVFKYIIKAKTSRMLLSMHNNGYFIETGWFNSVKYKMPVDENMNPIPWTTYSFIEYIKGYLTGEMDLFEYGCGNSTLFYAERVNSVISAEHCEHWYKNISEKVQENVKLIYCSAENSNEYSKSIETGKKTYDVIIVDGQHRNECIYNSVSFLKPGGILVLDDSERNDYKEGIRYLLDSNFRRIDFWGIAPMYFNNKCTTVFFRNK